MKKLLLLLVLLSGALFSYAQSTPYLLKGHIPGANGKVQLLLDPGLDDLNLKDSALVINGYFEITGNLQQAQPQFTNLWFKSDSVGSATLVTRPFLVTPGTQEITIDPHHFYEAPHADTGINRENQAFRTNIYPNDSTVMAFFDFRQARLSAKPPQPTVDSLDKALEAIKTQRDKYYRNYVLGHPSSYVSLWNLFDRVQTMGNRPQLREAYEGLDPALKDTRAGEMIKATLYASQQTAVGAIFPILPLETFDGKTTNLVVPAQKKLVLVDFWYSHCGPCIAQFEQLKMYYDKYVSKGFDIISVSTDLAGDKTLWHATVKKYALPWQQMLDIDRRESRKIAINSFPYNFVLDGSGKILFKNINMSELGQLLARN